MLRLIAPFALLPGVALAHGGPAGHAHPHGLEGVLLALALLVAGGVLLRRRLTRTTAPIPHSDTARRRGKRGIRGGRDGDGA